MDRLIKDAISTLQLASKMSEQYYHKPLEIAYSGGKDSDVLLDLAIRADIEISVVHSHTSVDAPQTYYHVEDIFRKLKSKGIKAERIYPTYQGKRITMWDLIPLKKMPPTRIARYCCFVLKENSTPASLVATGVRRAESNNRSKREVFEIRANTRAKIIKHDADHIREVYEQAQQLPDVYDCQFISKCKQNKDAIVNPLVHWTNRDIYQYIREKDVKICKLYEMGYARVGCVGCPIAGKHRYKEFRDFPAYKHNYILTFDRMLQGLDKVTSWASGQDVFDWWMEGKNIKGQMHFNF